MGWLTNPTPKKRCPACDGKGSTSGLGGLASHLCKRCDGKGEVEKR